MRRAGAPESGAAPGLARRSSRGVAARGGVDGWSVPDGPGSAPVPTGRACGQGRCPWTPPGTYGGPRTPAGGLPRRAGSEHRRGYAIGVHPLFRRGTSFTDARSGKLGFLAGCPEGRRPSGPTSDRRKPQPATGCPRPLVVRRRRPQSSRKARIAAAGTRRVREAPSSRWLTRPSRQPDAWSNTAPPDSPGSSRRSISS